MQATNGRRLELSEFLPRALRSIWHVVARSPYSLLSLLGIVSILAFAFGCEPSSQGDTQNSPASPSKDQPELTQEIIEERINDARVFDVLPESGTGEPIPWSFDEDEPKEITVVDRQMDGTRATVILDIKTQSSPRANNLRHLVGQIRTEWELRTGWVLRRWEIVRTENISMKYRDLPKQPAANSNR